MQNEHENETVNQSEGQQIQRELEQQLRDLGDTMSDAFAHGFEGRGNDIGDKAYGVGRAAVHAANFGINEAAKALRANRDAFAADRRGTDRQKTVFVDLNNAAENAGQNIENEMNRWARQIFRKKEKTPVELIRASAKKRHDAGCALLVVGITFAVIFGIGGIGSLAAAASFSPLVGTTLEGALLYGTAAELASVGSMALTGMQLAGCVLTMIAMGFGWMIYAGASRLSAAKKLNLFADAAEGMDARQGLPLEMLAQLTHQSYKNLRKNLRKFLNKGWLSAWLDEKTDRLYLTAEDYRAAQQEPAAEPEAQAQPDAAPETQSRPGEKSALNLETVRQFAQLLGKQQALMQDEQAREELARMQKTTASICDWLAAHPESLPKVRRFAEYYIPTTLKLLHTYNDVQGQQGETAQTIRRDIAGILHTLNQAYDTLYDTLLSDVAMDVSSEIAALQGMLANDGLTGRDFQ